MTNNRMSRGDFIRGAAIGAVAATGVASAQDHFPPGDESPDENIVVQGNKVLVYPTGDSYADWLHLNDAINNGSYPSEIHLMDKSKNGARTNFKLPTEYDPECELCQGYYGVEIKRNIKIIGQGNGATIDGGWAAILCYDEFSLSVHKLNFVNQAFAAISGWFNDVDIVASGANPGPLPEPAHGFVISVSGSILFKGNKIQNTGVGLFCAGAPLGGSIDSNSIGSQKCGIYLAGSDGYFLNQPLQNVNLHGNEINTSMGGISNIILEGQGVQGNKLTGNKFPGMPQIANIIIWDGVAGTFVRTGAGSVSSGANPEPLPKPTIINRGIGSDIAGNFTLIQNPAADSAISSLSEELRSFFVTEGGGDVGPG